MKAHYIATTEQRVALRLGARVPLVYVDEAGLRYQDTLWLEGDTVMVLPDGHYFSDERVFTPAQLAVRSPWRDAINELVWGEAPDDAG